jgi:hypothetical protein
MTADEVAFVDAMEDEAPLTAAETERYEAVRYAELVTLQLQQFQAQAAAFVAVTEPAQAPPVDPCADL